MIGSHGTNHSRGVMILFKPKLDVNIEQIISDKNGRYILAEVLVEGDRVVFLNIQMIKLNRCNSLEGYLSPF